jgi:pimeloyl-ACP methyl ester carboxylesterase
MPRARAEHTSAEPVIVAHGLWMPGYETGVLRGRLQRAGFAPRLFRFRTVGESLAGNVAELARFAERVEGESVHFVGYSLGAIVTLKLLAERDVGRPGRAVCLGPPIRGSSAARRLAALPGGRRALGRSILDLLDQHGLPEWASPREIGIIAGDLPVGLGRLLNVLPGPNDGTVAVEETRLAGAADHIVLHVSHASMLFSADVATQTIEFLRQGRFVR